MDWIFENIGKFLPIIVAIIYMIGSAKSRSKNEEEVDPAAAERARKIQEEIRRKILERQRGAQPSGPSVESSSPKVPARPEPALHEKTERGDHWHPVQERNARDVVEQPKSEQDDGWEVDDWGGFNQPASIYQDQEREIQEKLRKARELREQFATSGKERPAAAFLASRPRATSSGSLRSIVQGELKDRAAVRRAIILKEVLDTPVGLR